MGLPAVCYVVSDAAGSFTFSLVSPGVYTLAPYFHSPTTKYEVTPSKLEVMVSHDDLLLQQPFKVGCVVCLSLVYNLRRDKLV